jgi:hypothetical protein
VIGGPPILATCRRVACPLVWPTMLGLFFVCTYLPTNHQPGSQRATYLPTNQAATRSLLFSSPLSSPAVLPPTQPAPANLRSHRPHAGKIARQPPTRELFLSFVLLLSSPRLSWPFVDAAAREEAGTPRHLPLSLLLLRAASRLSRRIPFPLPSHSHLRSLSACRLCCLRNESRVRNK